MIISAQLKVALIALTLTAISALCDSQGFTHAAAIWKDDRIQWKEVALAVSGFVLGIAIYCYTIRYFLALGVVSAELQALIWFATAMVGVALFSGQFLRWPATEQGVAIFVLIGIGWLLVRVEH
ncbi:MAG: hypothetical protein AB7P69_18680 [Candidatus Binatia bacterium]